MVEWENEARPSMGRSWASVPNTRVQLHRQTRVQQCDSTLQSTSNGSGDFVRAVLTKSNKLPTGRFVDLKVDSTGVTQL